MIPINPLAMMIGSMIFIFSQVFLWLLIAGLLAFLIPRYRRSMLARPWLFGLTFVVLAAASVPYVNIGVTQWLDWRAHNPRLEREEVLGDLVLPAGTQVQLEDVKPFNDLSGTPRPYGMQSLKHADFERTPGNIMGIPVRWLELWQDHGSATVEILAATDLQGWRCEPGKVEFRFPSGAHFKFSEWRLNRCTLAPGSKQGGIVWPGSLTVSSSSGDSWDLGTDTPTRLLGLELRWLSMLLNKPDGEVLKWSGELNSAADFGPVHYPVGAQVSSFQGYLLFSPPPEAQALDRRTGTPIESDHSVMQSADGKVLDVRPNGEVGVWFYDEIVVP